jgi:hypothetical protein
MTTLSSTICAFVDSKYKLARSDKLALLELGFNVQQRPDHALNYLQSLRLQSFEIAVDLAVQIIVFQSGQGGAMVIEDLRLFEPKVWLAAIKKAFSLGQLARHSITQAMSISEMVGNRTGIANRLPCALRGAPKLLNDEIILKKLRDGRTSFKAADMIDLKACSVSRVTDYMARIKELDFVIDRRGNLDLLCAAAVLKKHYRLAQDVPDATKAKFVDYARKLGIQNDILGQGTLAIIDEAPES